MPRLYQFAVREAPSDISGAKLLAEAASAQQIELDYSLAAGASLGVVDQFICSPALPNQPSWAAGNYVASLAIVQAASIAISVALYHVDLNGNILGQVGSALGVQTAPNASELDPQVLTFSISGQAIQANATDRLLLQLLAENQDGSNAHVLGLLASASSLATPIAAPDMATNTHNPFRRNKFLGFFWRRGDGARFFDKNGVDLDRGSPY